MNFFVTELKKILTGRFVSILVIVLIANFLLFWHERTASNGMYGPEAMAAAQKEILAMDEEKRYPYVREQLRMLDACSAWQSYDIQLQNGAANLMITTDMYRYRDVYESGDYLKYTAELYAEQELFEEIFAQMQQLRDHRKNLQNAIKEAELKTSFAIFAKPNTFAYRSQLAMAEKYRELLPIQPVYDISEGVLYFQSFAASDLFALMLILYVCVEAVVTERKNGMLPILRSSQKGRLPLILSKLAAVFALSLAISLLLWGSNLAFSAGVFGLGDLSRPVQSLKGFSACALKISVGTYILWVFLFKWLLYAAIGIMGMLLGLFVRSASAVWVNLGGFLCAEYIFAQVIPSISAWNVLKYINISNMLFATDWLAEYRNVNVFGYPAAVFTACWVLLAGILVLGALSLCWLFCGRRFPMPCRCEGGLRWPRVIPRPGQSTILFGHELWKLLIECGTLVVLVLFAGLNLRENWVASLSTEELYYKNYMEVLEGPMNFEKEAFLQEEEQRFWELERQLELLEWNHQAGRISQDDFEILAQPLKRALEARKVYREQILPRIETVRQQMEMGKQAWLLYDPGYRYLFGVDGDHDKTGAMALLVAGIILSFANIYPVESTLGMQSLLNVYARGRMGTTRSKILICMLLTGVMYLIAQIPDYRFLIVNYGFPALNAPLCSLQAFAGWSDQVSVLGGIVIFEGLRMMAAFVVAVAVMAICQWTRNQLSAICICAGIFLVPLLLHLMGVELLDGFSFLRPLTGYPLGGETNPLPLSLLYYGCTAGLGAALIIRILRSARRGNAYRRPGKRS